MTVDPGRALQRAVLDALATYERDIAERMVAVHTSGPTLPSMLDVLNLQSMRDVG